MDARFWHAPHWRGEDWRQYMRRGMHGFGRAFGKGWFDFDWPGEQRARRGDIKYLILELLAERPRHGYEIMTDLEAAHGNRPSPGSVYPTLQMLEEGGFVTSDQREGKRVYTITGEGRTMLAARTVQQPGADDLGDFVREVAKEGKEAVWQLTMAIGQAAKLRDPQIWKRVSAVLDAARKEIYQILAEK